MPVRQNQTAFLAGDAVLRTFRIVNITPCRIQASFILLRTGKNVKMLIAGMAMQGHRAAGLIADEANPIFGIRVLKQ